MRTTYVCAGTPGNRPVRFSHVAPSLRVSQTLPSSVPAYSSPGRTYDSASVVMVPYVSAPVASFVTPPVESIEKRTFAMSRVLRSGEIGYRSSPRAVDLSTRLPPTYIVVGECGERKYGVFQLKRRSKSVESLRWASRNDAMRFCSSLVAALVVSPRTVR